MSRWKDAALLLLAVLCIALAAPRLVGSPPVIAQGTAGANADLIAVTGSYASGASVLYVIDTKTRNLAVYEARNGRSIKLVAARKIEYDLKLDRYRDDSEEAAQVPSLKRDWQRLDELLKKTSEDKSSDRAEKRKEN